jgi:menaquinol-cytochrome c reductase iron-sulfur subunit
MRCTERIFPPRRFAGTIGRVSEDGTDRREALRLFVLGGIAVAGCALAAPAAFVIAAPARGGVSKESWVPTVHLDALEEGVPKKVQVVSERNDAWTRELHVELGSAWLVRRGATVTAFSSVCPHLGCAVNAEAGGTFSCPCHTSSFAADGAVVSGPSPRGLDTLTTRIDDGVVVVDFRRFKVGTPDRIALT